MTSLAVPDQKPHGFSSVSRFANKPLSSETVKGLIAYLLKAPFAQRNRNASIELMCWGGGVINEVKPDAMAYVHRNSTTIPRVSTWWIADTPAAEQKKLLNWMKAALRLDQERFPERVLPELPQSACDDWKTAYYGRNLPKLVELKRSLRSSESVSARAEHSARTVRSKATERKLSVNSRG